PVAPRIRAVDAISLISCHRVCCFDEEKMSSIAVNRNCLIMSPYYTISYDRHFTRLGTISLLSLGHSRGKPFRCRAAAWPDTAHDWPPCGCTRRSARHCAFHPLARRACAYRACTCAHPPCRGHVDGG